MVEGLSQIDGRVICDGLTKGCWSSQRLSGVVGNFGSEIMSKTRGWQFTSKNFDDANAEPGLYFHSQTLAYLETFINMSFHSNPLANDLRSFHKFNPSSSTSSLVLTMSNKRNRLARMPKKLKPPKKKKEKKKKEKKQKVKKKKVKRGEEIDYLTNMPPEVLLRIISNVPLDCYLDLTQTCQHLRYWMQNCADMICNLAIESRFPSEARILEPIQIDNWLTPMHIKPRKGARWVKPELQLQLYEPGPQFLYFLEKKVAKLTKNNALVADWWDLQNFIDGRNEESPTVYGGRTMEDGFG